MSGNNWSGEDLARLREAYNKKPDYMTSNQLAGKLTRKFGRSVESIRWQLRQFRREIETVNPPKILILDIETSPIAALVWDVWKQDIQMAQIKKDWSILCWSAKWLFDTKVMGETVTPDEAREHEDFSVLESVWKLMNEADWIIWHNGKGFDAKKLNARFFVNGLPKPMYYQSIDTMLIAKDNFSFTYNKLDWIANITGIGRKIETEFEWWAECEQGNKKFLDKMLKYNKWDVQLEEEVYLKLRPWMEKHPNAGLYSVDGDVPTCPCCGSLDLHWNGTYTTALGIYKAFRCQDCSAIGRSTQKKFKLGKSPVQN